MKKIEYINDKEKENINDNGNRRVNNLRYIIIGNKDPPKKELKTKKNNKNHNIEISGQNLNLIFYNYEWYIKLVIYFERNG